MMKRKNNDNSTVPKPTTKPTGENTVAVDERRKQSGCTDEPAQVAHHKQTHLSLEYFDRIKLVPVRNEYSRQRFYYLTFPYREIHETPHGCSATCHGTIAGYCNGSGISLSGFPIRYKDSAVRHNFTTLDGTQVSIDYIPTVVEARLFAKRLKPFEAYRGLNETNVFQGMETKIHLDSYANSRYFALQHENRHT